MNCIYCDSALPERGFFCPSCRKQNKCKICSEALEPEAKICVMCGNDVETSASSPTMNSIEFTENKNGRSFKAHFTDNVGNQISQSLGLILANKVTTKVKPISGQEQDFQEAEYQEEIIIPALKVGDGLSALQGIFKDEGDKTSLIEPRLKAKSKQDFGSRLTCLYLYYKKLLGFEKVQRNELTIIAKQASIEDGNFRTWVKGETRLIRSASDQVELLLPGIEFAKKIIAELQDDSVIEIWKLGTKSKSGRSKSAKSKSQSGQDESPEIQAKNSASSKKDLKPSSIKTSKRSPTQTLNDLIGSGFFKSKKTIGDIVKHCKESLALTFKTTDLSGPLIKFTRDKKLSREQNTTTNQYEYTSI